MDGNTSLQSHETSPLLNSQSNTLRQRSIRFFQRYRLWIELLFAIGCLLLILITWRVIFHNNSSLSINANEYKKLMTMEPPFEKREHPIVPKLFDRTKHGNVPVPTNSFWTDLTVGDDHGLNPGAGQVTLSPYTVRCLPRRLEVSYGDTRRVVTDGNITEYFNADVAFTGVSVHTYPPSPFSSVREVQDFGPLSASLRYTITSQVQERWNEQTNSIRENGTHGTMDALLVRGAPYMTVVYEDLYPVLEMNATKLIAVNQEPISNGTVYEGNRFEIDIEVYSPLKENATQKWILYFETTRSLTLEIVSGEEATDFTPYNLVGELKTPTTFRFIDEDVYTGAARIAIVPQTINDTTTMVDTMELLDTHSAVYPTSSSIQTNVTSDLNVGRTTFCWGSKSWNSSNPMSTKVLLLAHPHHISSWASMQTAATILNPLGHRTLKSWMTPVVGSCWELEEILPSVQYDEKVTDLDSVINGMTDNIKSSLLADANYTPVAQDPYYFGKEVARQARLALIADSLGEKKLREKIVTQLEEWLTPWLTGSNDNHFVYDTIWGGICSKNGLQGVFYMSDFGNGWYNDHHFHYGYFIYTLAVVVKFNPSFATTNMAAILTIVRDIASPDDTDPYFPMTRHFSWFDGHSFASGVYTLEGGKSQESVSEAINAYYGVYLLGMALNLPEIQQIGHLLLAMEIRAAKTYWQMPKTNGIYEDLYAENKMTGQVACTTVKYTTWFGGEPFIEHMHLINMIPFTPIATVLLSQEYITEEYPVLQSQGLDRKINPMEPRWIGYAALAHAIVNPQKAWEEVQKLDFFDDGNSKTSSMYWISTRKLAE